MELDPGLFYIEGTKPAAGGLVIKCRVKGVKEQGRVIIDPCKLYPLVRPQERERRD